MNRMWNVVPNFAAKESRQYLLKKKIDINGELFIS